MVEVVIQVQIPEGLGTLQPLMADRLHDHHFRLVGALIQHGGNTVCRLLPCEKGGIGILNSGAFRNVDTLKVKPCGIQLTVHDQTTTAHPHPVTAELLSQKAGEVCALKLMVCNDTENAVPLIATRPKEGVCNLRGNIKTRQLGAVWSDLRNIRLCFRGWGAY